MLAGTAIAFITSRDERLMRRVQHWEAPRWVRLWMVCATRAGDGWAWYGLGISLLTAGGARRYAAVTAAGLAASVGIIVFRVIKKLTGRKRPSIIEPHCWATLVPADEFSFPSGHSITAFAVAVPVSLFYPPLGMTLIFCALNVAVSRIVLGMHFLSDVVIGSLIGTGLGYVFFLLLA